MEYEIGTEYLSGGKFPQLCIVTDIFKTYNAAGELVRTRYVSTHKLLGQTVTEENIVDVTIARGIHRLQESI